MLTSTRPLFPFFYDGNPAKHLYVFFFFPLVLPWFVPSSVSSVCHRSQTLNVWHPNWTRPAGSDIMIWPETNRLRGKERRGKERRHRRKRTSSNSISALSRLHTTRYSAVQYAMRTTLSTMQGNSRNVLLFNLDKFRAAAKSDLDNLIVPYQKGAEFIIIVAFCPELLLSGQSCSQVESSRVESSRAIGSSSTTNWSNLRHAEEETNWNEKKMTFHLDLRTRSEPSSD